jgi:hypothetical protein
MVDFSIAVVKIFNLKNCSFKTSISNFNTGIIIFLSNNFFKNNNN